MNGRYTTKALRQERAECRKKRQQMIDTIRWVYKFYAHMCHSGVSIERIERLGKHINAREKIIEAYNKKLIKIARALTWHKLGYINRRKKSR